jgi:hypothetical protein
MPILLSTCHRRLRLPRTHPGEEAGSLLEPDAVHVRAGGAVLTKELGEGLVTSALGSLGSQPVSRLSSFWGQL